MKNCEVRIGGIAFGILGIVLLTFSLSGLLHSLNMIFRGVETPGKIGEWIVRDGTTGQFVDSRGRRFRSRGVLIEYTTAEGKTREFLTAQPSGGPDSGYEGDSYGQGDTVTVLYLPHRPEVAELKLFDRLWFNPLFVGVFGLLCLGAGGILFFVLSKKPI